MIGVRLGPYEVTAKLGEGGMGEVYRATDTRLDRQVALKVLPAAFLEDKERLARFEREAKVLAQLNHPNIAAIHGLEESEGTRALVMELVEGPTLAERLEQGPFPLRECLAVAVQIAHALEEAHEKGIVHRDLKPQNIKASIEGKTKVLDFGLAKAMDPSAGSAASAADLARSPTLMQSPTLTAAHGTQMGVILGTAAYMAPEQARGVAVDKRADIWAFGVVLFEMLTGRRLFEGELVTDVLADVLRREIDFAALPAEVPASIRRLLRRCLERNPKNRLHDIADARIVLEEVIAGRGDEQVAIAGAASAAAAPTSRPWWPIVSTAVVLAAATFVGGVWVGGKGASGAAPEPELRFRKLTFLPGEELVPELSADGRTLIFCAADDRVDLFSVPVGGKRPVALTGGSGADNCGGRLSPDGSLLAFHSSRDGGGLFVMGVTGESVRRIAEAGFHPAWSPDGRTIAYSSDGPLLPSDRGLRGQLRVLELATGASRPVIPGDVDAVHPVWSPSGKRIAFWGLRGEGGNREISTADVQSGAVVAVASHPGVDWNPVWSEDGRFLYFLSDRGGTMNRWRIAIDEATGATAGAPQPVPLPADNVVHLARSGKRWVYSAHSSRSEIRRWEFDPDRPALVGPPKTLVSTTSTLLTVRPSPDGRRLAFSTVTPAQDLFVVGADGGSPTQLTDDPEKDRWPEWSPDGKRILFMSERGERYEIWGIDPDGGGLTQLTRTSEESMWFPKLSPAGDRLLLTSERSVSIFDASGPPPWTKFERLPQPPGEAGATFSAHSWSSDGKSVVGQVGSRVSPVRLALFDLATRSYRILDHPSSPVGWFPDGRRLLVRAADDRLAVLDLATWREIPLAPEPALGAIRGATSDLRALFDLDQQDEADVWLAEEVKQP